MIQSQPLEQQVHALIDGGLAPNTRKANDQDMRYFQRWCQLRFNTHHALPASQAKILQFIVDHSQALPESVENVLIEE